LLRRRFTPRWMPLRRYGTRAGRDRWLQADYADETGVQSLKIKHNNVLGYFIEVTATTRRQDAVRALSAGSFIARPRPMPCGSPRLELSELETRILNAGTEALEIEMALFAELREACDRAQPRIRAARALAELDVHVWRWRARRPKGLVPARVDDSRAFAIVAGRHPVVEAALPAAGIPSSPMTAVARPDEGDGARSGC
jgi:DNA mismatch repair protein MutS